MRYPVFTIITPSYNQASFIRETIESVLSQQGDFYIDYIIMDGGSTDNSVNIIREYEILLKNHCAVKKHEGHDFYVSIKTSFIFNKCCGISYRWFSEKDNGQAHAINKGIGLAVGEIIAFINSDDCYARGAFQIINEYYAIQKSFDIVYGNALCIDDQSKYIQLYKTKDINSNDILGECFICQPSVFFQKDVFDKAGLFNEKINNSFDYEYWVRLWKNDYSFELIQNILAFSRLYENTKTRKNRKEIYSEILAINLQYAGKYHRSWKFKLTKETALLIKLLQFLVKAIIKATSFIYPFTMWRKTKDNHRRFFHSN
jgi:glycosyltransferase involved in cell wall biosynthesis